MTALRRVSSALFGLLVALASNPSIVGAQSIEFNGSIFALDPPSLESTGLEQVIGGDETTPLNQFHPHDLYRKLAHPVGRLATELTNGKSAYCTAALVSEDLILTNAHCIFDSSGRNIVRAGILSMGYLTSGVIDGTEQYEVDTATPVEAGTPGSEGDPDYVLLRVTSGNPGRTWGTVQLSQAAPLEGGSLAIMHHPLGFPMVVSAGGNCRSLRATANDVFHVCDTQPGSSGAPVFALVSSSVVALHYRKSGLSENAAVRMDRLLEVSPVLSEIVASYASGLQETSDAASARPMEDVSQIDPATETRGVLDPLDAKLAALANQAREGLLAQIPARSKTLSFMLFKELGVSSATELDGAIVCLRQGTIEEQIVAEYFKSNRLVYEPLSTRSAAESLAQYEARNCDVYVGSPFDMQAVQLSTEDPDRHMILPEIASF